MQADQFRLDFQVLRNIFQEVSRNMISRYQNIISGKIRLFKIDDLTKDTQQDPLKFIDINNRLQNTKNS